MNTILVVEDDELLLNLLQNKLAQSGYDVMTAKDGVDGLEALKSKQVDLIILDVMMPRMDGLTMLKQLRQDSKFDSVRVIILSNMDESDAKVQAFANQVDDYLVKTHIDTEEVVEKVRKVLKVY